MFVAGYQLRLLPVVVNNSRLKQHVCSNCARHHICVKMLSFSVETGPESLPPLACRLLTVVVCWKSAQTSTSCCFSWAKSCLASCTQVLHAACRLIDGLVSWLGGRPFSGEIKPAVCFLTQECHCWTCALRRRAILQWCYCCYEKPRRWFSTRNKLFNHNQYANE